MSTEQWVEQQHVDSQPEFFADLQSTPHPQREFAEFHVGKKIIKIPFSVWKDGRVRADLSKYGAGCPVSRSRDNLCRRIADALRAVQAVSEEYDRVRQRPSRPRSVNKLAPQVGPSTAALNFFNPKPLIAAFRFSPVPTWLRAVPQITPTEQLVYGAMIFRADEDGTFRRSLLGLSKLIRVSDRGIQKAAESLENRSLIFKVTSRRRIPNDYKFVWFPEFDTRSSEQCSLEGVWPDEHSSAGLAKTVRQSDEQSSLHKNKEPVSKNHEHDHVDAPVGLTAEQEDLISQVNELTHCESRIEHFRSVWEARVREDSLAVFQAIGETRRTKREGKVKKSVGGLLAWHYKSFHKTNAARRSAQQSKSSKGPAT